MPCHRVDFLVKILCPCLAVIQPPPDFAFWCRSIHVYLN
jgi:hypothetical protein